jgi:hypothetical protein
MAVLAGKGKGGGGGGVSQCQRCFFSWLCYSLKRRRTLNFFIYRILIIKTN